MELILLGAITSPLKHVIGKSLYGFSKCESCLTNLIAFSDKVTCLIDVGGAVALSVCVSARLLIWFPIASS